MRVNKNKILKKKAR